MSASGVAGTGRRRDNKSQTITIELSNSTFQNSTCTLRHHVYKWYQNELHRALGICKYRNYSAPPPSSPTDRRGNVANHRRRSSRPQIQLVNEIAPHTARGWGTRLTLLPARRASISCFSIPVACSNGSGITGDREAQQSQILGQRGTTESDTGTERHNSHTGTERHNSRVRYRDREAQQQSDTRTEWNSRVRYWDREAQQQSDTRTERHSRVRYWDRKEQSHTRGQRNNRVTHRGQRGTTESHTGAERQNKVTLGQRHNRIQGSPESDTRTDEQQQSDARTERHKSRVRYRDREAQKQSQILGQQGTTESHTKTEEQLQSDTGTERHNSVTHRDIEAQQQSDTRTERHENRVRYWDSSKWVHWVDWCRRTSRRLTAGGLAQVKLHCRK